MFSTLLRIITLVLGLWLLQRLLSAILGGRNPGRPQDAQTKPSQKMVKDPVCGMYMDSRLAVPLVGGKETLYFCSEECKNKYLSAAPGSRKASSTGQ